MKYLDKTGLTYLWGKIKGFVNSHEHPVGSIYITTSSMFNPATQWGGTWEKTAAGRCLIGASSAYPLGSTGGENTHSLSVQEMPKHQHATANGAPIWSQSDGYGSILANSSSGANKANLASSGTTYAGDSQAHNNMQPYLSVNIWKRTA